MKKFVKPATSGWLSISDETVFEAPIFTIGRELSRCVRSGAEHYFYYLDCRNWVTILAVTPDDELVMIHQYRHGSGEIELEIPGGCIDPEDSYPVATGRRELLEETGYAGENGRIIGKVNPNPALQGNTCYTILFENCRKIHDPQLEDTEELSTFTIPLRNLDEMVRQGKISHALVLNALYFFDLSRKRV